MESQGIKPDHVPITRVAPEPVSGQAGASLVAPVIRVPDLVSRPAWSAGAIIYVLALFLTLWAGVLVGEGVLLHLMAPQVAGMGASLSVLLMIAGTVQTSRSRPIQGRTIRLVLSGLLIGYCGFTMMWEPFTSMNGRGVQRLTFTIAWLIPLLLAAVWFARRRSWLQAIAVALFLFASVDLIAYNLHRGIAGFMFEIRE